MNSAQELELKRAQQPPYEITFDNTTYTQLKEADTYIHNEKPYTPNQLLTLHYPLDYKKIRPTQIVLPPLIQELSLSNRVRFYFYVLQSQQEIEIHPDAVHLSQFFSHYADYPAFMSKFYSDYKCCFFATGENALKAASLFLYHGMASSLNGLREKIDKCCCFKSTLLPDGIKIELKDALSPYELADHVQEILINTRLMALERFNKKEYLDANDIKDIEQTAYSSLYRAHGGRLSLTAELTQSCNGYIGTYIERAFLNAFYQKHGNFPDPTRPENLETLEVEWLTEFNGEKEIFVPFTDFKITYGTTDRQYKRGAECGYQNSLTYWTQKLLEHPELSLDGEEEYKKSFLVDELGVYNRNLVAAKNYGIISSPRRGYYKLDFLRDQDLARKILEAQQEKEMEGLTF